MLPVPVDSAPQQDGAAGGGGWKDSASFEGSMNRAGVRARAYAPFIAQLAGQDESPRAARSRRQERRESANESYEQSAARARPRTRPGRVVLA